MTVKSAGVTMLIYNMLVIRLPAGNKGTLYRSK